VARIFVPRLETEQAQATLYRILDAIAKTTYHYQDRLEVLGQMAKITGGSVVPRQASAIVDHILSAIYSSSDDRQGIARLRVLEALGSKLTFEQAQALLDPLLTAVIEVKDVDRLALLAQAVHSLGPTPGQVEVVFATITEALNRTSRSRELSALANAAQSLGPPPSAETQKYAADTFKTQLSTADEPGMAVAFAGAVATLLPSEPPEIYVAGIVQLLKWPTTAGPATDVLLTALHERMPGAPGKEAGLDATVAWVAATYPDIDLDSPPTFPVSGSTGGGW
jgi:hypothetical protein